MRSAISEDDRLEEEQQQQQQLFDVVGPVCESADFVGKSMRKKLKSKSKQKIWNFEIMLLLFQLFCSSLHVPIDENFIIFCSFLIWHDRSEKYNGSSSKNSKQNTLERFQFQVSYKKNSEPYNFYFQRNIKTFTFRSKKHDTTFLFSNFEVFVVIIWVTQLSEFSTWAHIVGQWLQTTIWDFGRLKLWFQNMAV